MQRISQVLEIPIQANWNHFFYLGLPISKENLKVELWSTKTEKMKEKNPKLGSVVVEHCRQGYPNQSHVHCTANLLICHYSGSSHHPQTNGINNQGFSMAGREKGDQKFHLSKIGASNFSL